MIAKVTAQAQDGAADAWPQLRWAMADGAEPDKTTSGLKASLSAMDGAPFSVDEAGTPARFGGRLSAIGGLTILILIFILGMIGSIAVHALTSTATAGPGENDGASDAKLPPDSPALSDATALDHGYETKADAACEIGVAAYMHAVSPYPFKWDDAAEGTFGIIFDKYAPRVVSPGVLTIISTRILLQNGAGAFRHAQLDCRYDTQADNVQGYDLKQ